MNWLAAALARNTSKTLMTNCSQNSSCESGTAVQGTNKLHQKYREAQCATNRRNHRRPPEHHSGIKYFACRNACINHHYVQQARKNVRDVDNVNQHLVDTRVATLGNLDEEPITSENVEIHSPKEYHPRVRTLLRKNEEI